MAPDNSAAVISLRQSAPRAMTAAQRAKAYRDRKRNAKLAPADATPARRTAPADSSGASAASLAAVTAPVTPPKLPLVTAPVTFAPVTPPDPWPRVTLSRLHLAPMVLNAAALSLAAIGVAINGWFARSLGSSDFAGWLFLALGVAADLIALGMPSCAAHLWRVRHRAASLVGWALWLVTFVFTVTASLGFASTNVSDVTLARASRVTPAVTSAQAALSDALAARDRECKGGVGRYCREREAALVERRQVLEAALTSVEQTADPQASAAVRLVAWGSFGTLRPAPEDFAMLRLILLAVLPQLGGLLMLVAAQREREH